MSVSYGYEKNETGITLTDLYGEAEGALEVPEEWKGKTVTAVGEALFRGQKKLTAVTFPETVTELGWWVLRECTALTAVHLPSGLKTIGYRAFSGCTALKTIELPEETEWIGEAAFWGCTALKRIVLPPKIRTISNRMFYGCGHLTDIVLPSALETIEWGAFECCGGLRSLTIPDNVTKIGSNALRECGGLKELNLPDGMESISENLFGHRHLPRLERGYIPHARLELWEAEARLILVLCFLTTRERHRKEEQALYDEYIFDHEDEILTAAVETANITALDGLYGLGLPSAGKTDGYIALANRLRCREAVVSLMEYKRRNVQPLSVEEQLAAAFSLDDF